MLNAGDVQVFLNFLEDEHKKRGEMTDAEQDDNNESMPQKPWTHLSPPPAFPGQPRLSLAMAATILAQERTVKLHTTSVQAEPMNVEPTTAQLPAGLPPVVVGATQEQSFDPMNIEVDSQAGRLNKGRAVGQILAVGKVTQGEVTCCTPTSPSQATTKNPGIQGPSRPVDPIVSPRQQVGKGVETVQSEDETESLAHSAAPQDPPMVSPAPVAPPPGWPPLPLPPLASTIPPPPVKAPARPPHTSILCSWAQPKNIPLNTLALESIRNLTVTVDTPQNLHPQSSRNGGTFASVAIFHQDPSVEPGVNMYKCLKKVFELLLHANPRSTLLTLYADEAGVAAVLITTICETKVQ